MSRYIYWCIQSHMDKHGDNYYREGVQIRNRVNIVMSVVERARRGEDGTVPTFAQADLLIKLDKRKPGAKRAAPTPQVRKVRSDALVFKLSPEQRKEIADRLATGTSYRKIIELCATWNIKTSLGSLTEYLKTQK
jgi:hypothetical protein